MKKKSYTVAVTGFGPFMEYDYNPSTSIRDNLPRHLIRKDKPPIHILKYPHNINCIYNEVLNLVPQLWSGNLSVYDPGTASTKLVEIDLMVHIGMHPDSKGYFLEKRARRGKYEQPGDDGSLLARDALKGLPEKFLVGLDLDGIAARVAESVGDDSSTLIKTSNDAGLYFCELISFLSLSILDQRKEFARVVFLHVPTGRDDECINRGVRVAQALIEQCVDGLPGDYRLAA